MVDRIYTQADYDKVTDLYNEYQNKKDSYTPEQQEKIEAAFSDAWASTSNKIEEWNHRIVDMRNDDQGNSRAQYGDGRKEIVNQAPTPAPTPTQTPTPKRQNPPLTNDQLREREYINAGYTLGDDNMYYSPSGVKVESNGYNLGKGGSWIPTEEQANKDRILENNLLRRQAYVDAGYKVGNDDLFYTPSGRKVYSNGYNLGRYGDWIKDDSNLLDKIPDPKLRTLVNKFGYRIDSGGHLIAPDGRDLGKVI